MSAADVSSDVETTARMILSYLDDGVTIEPHTPLHLDLRTALAARAAGRDNAIDVPRCGYCHWPFDSFESGCAQCTTGGVYSDARNAWRLANRAALDESGEGTA